MKFLCLLLFIVLTIPVYSQMTGIVKEKESGELLSHIPVLIVHENSQKRIIIYSDSLGVFSSELDQEGAYSVTVSALGYQPIKFDKIAIIHHQIRYLEIALSRQQYLIHEVVVSPSAWGIDRTSGISAYEINPHLMNITVGSSYDILRSATLIPGISNTSDISNDLNIRGNSPFGTSWYIEDVPVISPNHFSDNNSANSVFSAFDSWGVNKSQIFMSVFPVEYGNALSGVINTELRAGNTQKVKGNVSLSTIYAGAVLEAPIKKDKSSIIAGFRYTFPQYIPKLFPSYSKKLGCTPDVLDGFFKLQSSINKNLKFSLWGIGGNSRAVFHPRGTSSDEIVLERKGSTISSGLSLDYYKNALAVKSNIYTSHGNNYVNNNSENMVASQSGWTGVNSKLIIHNPNSKILFGIDFKRRYYNQYRERADLFKDSIHTAYANDFSSFCSYTYYFRNRVMVQGGLHYLYNGIANRQRLEPRMEISKQFTSFGTLSLGFREHSTNTPIGYLYTFKPEFDDKGHITMVTRNKVSLPLMKSRHFVLGWDKKYNNGLKLGSELFYQHLYDISEIVLSEGYTSDPNDFRGPTLSISQAVSNSSDIGRNYGIELSVDAPIASRNLYFYLAGTVFNSELKTHGKWIPTLYNSTFSFTSAVRKEYILTDRIKFSTSLNYIIKGGRRYTPIDDALTAKNKQRTLDKNRINACQYPYYSRLDASVSLSTSTDNFTHSFSVEVQNLFNRENMLERYEYYSHEPIILNQVMRVFVYKYVISF